MQDKRIFVVIAIVAVFAALIAVKALTSGPGDAATTDSAGGTAQSAGASDGVAEFEAALASGKPVYVLFHSLTCQPCVEISAVADEVVPEYAPDVEFVDAITDDPAGRELAARFQFQYIPSSFFIGTDGEVFDAHTGTLSAEELRSRLDALVGEAR